MQKKRKPRAKRTPSKEIFSAQEKENPKQKKLKKTEFSSSQSQEPSESAAFMIASYVAAVRGSKKGMKGTIVRWNPRGWKEEGRAGRLPGWLVKWEQGSSSYYKPCDLTKARDCRLPEQVATTLLIVRRKGLAEWLPFPIWQQIINALSSWLLKAKWISKFPEGLKGHSDTVTSIAAVGEGLVASGGNDGDVRIWDVATGKCVKILEGHTDGVFSIAWLRNADGKVAALVSGGYDQTLCVWYPVV